MVGLLFAPSLSSRVTALETRVDKLEKAHPSPSPTPTPSPSPTANPAACGTPMPTTAPAGFRYIKGENFTTPAAQGSVATHGTTDTLIYSEFLEPYGEGWTDNFGGTYAFVNNASVADGALKIQVRSVNGVNQGAAWTFMNPETHWGFTYGAVTQCVKVTGNLPGYGSASLLWPDSDVWGDGEIDYPEGDFAGVTRAYHHGLGAEAAQNKSIFETGENWLSWHVYRIEWKPTGTSYFIDGRLIGTNTNATPTTSHHWVTQIGRHSGGLRDVSLSGVYAVDWVTMEAVT